MKGRNYHEGGVQGESAHLNASLVSWRMRSESDGEFSRCKAFGKKACKVAGPVRFGERAEPGNAPYILLVNCRNFLDREVSQNSPVWIYF